MNFLKLRRDVCTEDGCSAYVLVGSCRIYWRLMLKVHREAIVNINSLSLVKNRPNFILSELVQLQLPMLKMISSYLPHSYSIQHGTDYKFSLSLSLRVSVCLSVTVAFLARLSPKLAQR